MVERNAGEILTRTNPNLDKAAILLLSLESESPGITAKVLGAIGEDRAKTLISKISALGKITPDKRSEALNDFYQIALEKLYVFGGEDISSKILADSFGISEPLDFFQDRKEAFKFLEEAETIAIYKFLMKETNQVRLFMLQFLPPTKAAELINLIEDESFMLKLMQQVELPDKDFLFHFESELAACFSDSDAESIKLEDNYIQKLATTIEYLPKIKREKLLAKFSKTDKKFAAELKEFIFSFEEFIDVPDEVFQQILFEITDFRMIALARLNTDQALIEKIDACITDRTKAIVDSEAVGLEKKVTEEQIEEAKRVLISQARALEKKGVLKLRHGTKK